MPFSEFTRLAKTAIMLKARDRIVDINVCNFSKLDEKTRRGFHSDLTRAASQFIETKVKDYKEVLSNIARALNGRR